MTMHVILGSGEMPTKEVNATLTDLWQKDVKAKEQHWYLIQGKAEPTDTDRAILAWLHKNEIWYDVITDGDYDKALYTEVQTVHTAKRLAPKVVGLMNTAKEGSEEEDPEEAELLALFTDLENFSAEEDRWLNDVGLAVQQAGFTVFALNDGMVEVDMSDAPEEPEEPAEAAAPTKSKGKTPAKAAAPSYTEEELLDKDRSEVIAIATELGIELPPKTRINTYIKAILEQGAAAQEVEVAPVVEPGDETGEEEAETGGPPEDEREEATLSAALIVVVFGGSVISHPVSEETALAVIASWA